MTTAGALVAALVAAVVAMLLGACAGEARDPATTDLDPATAMVEYRYNDSSVPPEYHRSYTITVQEGEARMVVDSYGDELHDVTESVDDEVWSDLLARVGALEVGGGRASDGCSGGTSREMQATDAEHPPSDPAVRARAEVCGGDGEADAEAIDAAIEPVLARFDTDELLATG